MRKPGIAVVGTGFIGPLHVEALRRLALPVAGLLASTPEKGRKAVEALSVPRSFDSFEELLADPAVQVVHVATPNRLHFDQCRRALVAGKHVLCEKPLAMNSVETATLVDLARRTPCVTAVNYNVRFYPLCAEARQRVADGTLGEIYQITGSYEQDWLLSPTDFNWRVLPEEGGLLRAVADIGTHWLDLVTWIAGLEVESACADLRTFVPIRQKPASAIETFQGKISSTHESEAVQITTEDYGSALLHFRGGARGCFTVSQVTAGRKNCLRFEIAGSKQSLAWNSEQPNELWIGQRDQPNQVLVRDPALLHASARQWAATPGGHNEGFADTFKQLFRAVYDAIERGENSKSRNYPTFEDGHREVALCEAILKSHQERRWIDVAVS
jgi:predicted dehydrogenase